MMLKNWELTVNHPMSHYGMPVFLFNAVAHGPRDRISTFNVAEIVKEWADETGRTDEEKTLAGKFLRQWPDGPQLDRVPGVRGQPQQFASTENVAFRLDQLVADKCPRNSKGNIDPSFLRHAVALALEEEKKDGDI